jgi:hypothetical protein
MEGDGLSLDPTVAPNMIYAITFYMAKMAYLANYIIKSDTAFLFFYKNFNICCRHALHR